MKKRHLTDTQSAKINADDHKTFERGEDDDAIKVIMNLRPPPSDIFHEEPNPEDSADLSAWRNALIKKRSEQIRAFHEKTYEELRALSLTFNPGSVLNSIVISGTIAHVLQALSLPGVIGIFLDRPINLIRPKK